MKIVSRKPTPTNVLPSAHQLDDSVNAEDYSGRLVPCVVVGVKFTAGKVYYDLAIVDLVSGSVSGSAVAREIDSSQVTKR